MLHAGCWGWMLGLDASDSLCLEEGAFVYRLGSVIPCQETGIGIYDISFFPSLLRMQSFSRYSYPPPTTRSSNNMRLNHLLSTLALAQLSLAQQHFCLALDAWSQTYFLDRSGIAGSWRKDSRPEVDCQAKFPDGATAYHIYNTNSYVDDNKQWTCYYTGRLLSLLVVFGC